MRCTSQVPGTTFLRGLIPGYGQFTTWSRMAGLGVASLVVTGAIVANNKNQQADALYKQYQITLSARAPQYYLAAHNRQHDAQLVATVAAGIWIGSSIEAEVQERIHAARLAAVREFWLRPFLTPTPASGNGNSLGLAGGLQLSFR
jgi:hypothetical protein